MKPVLYVFALEPCLMIKHADGGHNRQEEQPEHEIGRRPQPFIQKMPNVEEKQRRKDNGESPSAQHQDVRILVEIYPPFVLVHLQRLILEIYPPFILVHLQRLILEIYPLIRVFMGRRGRNGPFLLSQNVLIFMV
jgi:hypothetical protein